MWSREDHLEGMTLFAPDGGDAKHILVVYDNFCEGRRMGIHTVELDIFP
jgi:hypothetical protein